MKPQLVCCEGNQCSLVIDLPTRSQEMERDADGSPVHTVVESPLASRERKDCQRWDANSGIIAGRTVADGVLFVAKFWIRVDVNGTVTEHEAVNAVAQFGRESQKTRCSSLLFGTRLSSVPIMNLGQSGLIHCLFGGTCVIGRHWLRLTSIPTRHACKVAAVLGSRCSLVEDWMKEKGEDERVQVRSSLGRTWQSR